MGQGLAGTLLASALEDLGKTFYIIDDLNKYAASRQAAGIINPVSGRRYVKSWNYDELEKNFVPFYERQCQKVKKSIFGKHQILLCLASVKEENDLLAQAARYNYLDKIKHVPCPEHVILQNKSVVYSLQGYKLNISELCNSFRELWISQGKLLNQKFDYQFALDQNTVIYKDIRAYAMVFCEGAFINQNPYFNHIQVIPNKGQFMLINKEDWKENYSVKDKIIVSPMQDGWWVGATYEWIYDSPEPDLMGRNELTIQLDKLIASPFVIKKVLSGLRPTTKNRRPLIIRHPIHSNLWTINGFGTKGSSLGPYMVNQFLGICLEGITNRFENDYK